LKNNDENDEVEASKNFLYKLEEILTVDSNIIHKIHKISYKICSIYLNNQNIPSKGEKNFIKKVAKRNLHKCYICSRSFKQNDESTNNRSKMEIEHIFPRIYGGSRNKQNLTVCCEHCNKIKDDMISYSDAFFESFITSSSKDGNINSALKKDIKLSLLLKQNVECSICNKKFHNIEHNDAFYLIKKEDDDIYHYFNSEFCCKECFEKKDLEGVKFEFYL
jgi:hypothetical protein